MNVLPVIDLLDGQVVRGVGGRRGECRPIVSRLVASAQPLAVARAFRDTFHLSEMYLADLGAIAGQEPAWSIYRALLDDGFRLWVDSGLGANTIVGLARLGVHSIIAGLESLPDAATLAELLQRLGPERLVFSLDLKHGTPLGNCEGLGNRDAWSIVQAVIELGVERLLLLDLAGVGESKGTPTLALCQRLHLRYPDVEFSTGGGVRDSADLQALRLASASFALVASALHDGMLTHEEIGALAQPNLV